MSKFTPAQSRQIPLTLILATEASTSSGTCIQVEGDEEDWVSDILNTMNGVANENGCNEEEDQCNDEREIAVVSPKGKGKRRGKLI